MATSLQAHATGATPSWRERFAFITDSLMVGVVVLIAIVVAALAGLWYAAKWVHTHIGQMKRTMVAASVIIASAFYYSYLYAQEFSAFTAGLVAAAFGCSLFYLIVRYGHTKLDVIEQLRNGNEAVSDYFKSYALIIALTLGCALLASVL